MVSAVVPSDIRIIVECQSSEKVYERARDLDDVMREYNSCKCGGKGMRIEECFFGYRTNFDCEPDFAETGKMRFFLSDVLFGQREDAKGKRISIPFGKQDCTDVPGTVGQGWLDPHPRSPCLTRV